LREKLQLVIFRLHTTPLSFLFQGYGPYDHPAIAFNSVPARTRASRRHVMNRDEVERSRLRERRFGFQEYAEPGGLIAPDAHDSALYVAEQDRFRTDAAAEEKDARDQAFMKRVGEIERRRGFYSGLTAKIKEVEDVEARRWEENTHKLQERPTASLVNKGGLPVNIVTHEYESDSRGEQLKSSDTQMLSRAALRAQYLAEHSSSAADFNILSNTQRAPNAAVEKLATSLGVPVPPPMGVKHQNFVNFSTTGPHMKVREETRSAPRLKNFIR